MESKQTTTLKNGGVSLNNTVFWVIVTCNSNLIVKHDKGGAIHRKFSVNSIPIFLTVWWCVTEPNDFFSIFGVRCCQSERVSGNSLNGFVIRSKCGEKSAKRVSCQIK